MPEQEQPGSPALKELDDVLEDLVSLLKNPEVCVALTARGVNISLAIVGAEGVAAYVHGEKARAAEDFATIAEEITMRLGSAAQSDSKEKSS